MKPTYLVSAAEMKQYDATAVREYKIPSLVLMERAALAAVHTLKEETGDLCGKKILAVCGGGNNGGDGLAMARILLEEGFDVKICISSPPEKCSEETKRQLAILEACGQEILTIFPGGEYDLIIDALFGVGLSRNIEGSHAEWIHKINASGAYVASVDIPSGINADSGACMGVAVQADLTVTFAFPKRGLYFFPGREYAGKVVCKEIGITAKCFGTQPPACFTYEKETQDFVSGLLPGRSAGGNKGTFGKLLVVAGSEDMSGAALLCAESALRVGAGMVKVVTHESNRTALQTGLPEAMTLFYGEDDDLTAELQKAWKWADGIVAGPGMGTKEAAAHLLAQLLAEADRPLILDADALNLLAGNAFLMELAKKREEAFPEQLLVLTTHQGELARLTGKEIIQLKEEPVKYAGELAKRLHCVVASKDAATVVITEKEPFFLNTAGNNGMATAGSGDVLVGILGGLFVQEQHADPLEETARGVFLHACAGDLARKKVGEHAMTAGDLIESLKEISKNAAKEE